MKKVFRRLLKASKAAVKANPKPAFAVDALESRQMMSTAPWGVQGRQIGQDLAVANYPTINGAGQTIAVIDMGVDVNHPALGGGIGAGHKIIDGYDFITNTSDPSPKDSIPHGTATVGMLAADPYVLDGYRYQGVAPGAKIIALRAWGDSITSAFNWVIAHRAQDNIVAVEVLGASAALQGSQIQTLVNAGVFIGSPSSNGGPYKMAKGIPGIVLTGSVDSSNNISSFTQRGAGMDMLAPGQNVAVTWDSNGQPIEMYGEGTSWSSPQVVGTAALIKQINPAFNEAQILSILKDSGTKIYDSVTGMTYSELNVNAALATAISRSHAAPPATTPSAPPSAPPAHKGKSGKTLAARAAAASPAKGKSGKTLAARAAAAAAASKKAKPATASTSHTNVVLVDAAATHVLG